MEKINSILSKQGRKWIQKMRDPDETEIKIMTYNFLASTQLEKWKFPKHNSKQLSSEQRYGLICKELEEVNPDICFVQEIVESDLSYFEQTFVKMNYSNYLRLKNTHDTLQGNMILYKKQKFQNLGNYFSGFYFDKNYNRQDKLAQEMYHGTNAVYSILQHNGSKKTFLAISTHLPYNNNRGHVKLGCLVIILKSIQKLKELHQIDEVVMGGDFNTIPNSMLYSYLVKGELVLDASLQEYSNQKMMEKLFQKDWNYQFQIQNKKFRKYEKFVQKKDTVDKEFLSLLTQMQVKIQEEEVIFYNEDVQQLSMEQCQDQLEELSQSIQFKSSYSIFKKHNKESENNFEPNLTFWPNKCLQTVDYIFFTQNVLKVNGILEVPQSYDLQQQKTTIPNENFGSDHFSLTSVFSVNQFNKVNQNFQFFDKLTFTEFMFLAVQFIFYGVLNRLAFQAVMNFYQGIRSSSFFIRISNFSMLYLFYLSN